MVVYVEYEIFRAYWIDLDLIFETNKTTEASSILNFVQILLKKTYV